MVGKIVSLREKLHYGQNDKGASYSHVSISLDNGLHNMMSFARKKVNNPLIAGLVKEDISSGVFALRPNQNHIAVICLKISDKTYKKLSSLLDDYWQKKDIYRYDTYTLLRVLFKGRDRKRYKNNNAFCCSMWVDYILRESGLRLFDDKLYTVAPSDYYHKLKDNIIYEGLTKEYSSNAGTKNTSHILQAAETVFT